MIVIDTNVISELWKSAPNISVIAWLDAQAVETLYLSAITVAELRYGLASMPAGKRRSLFQSRFEADTLPMFSGRILSFDSAASQAYAVLMAHARSQGMSIGKADGYIAATAMACGFMVATRDTSPFLSAGLKVINPWTVEE
jgi:hypothetical protein